jgi:hypothetical protein
MILARTSGDDTVRVESCRTIWMRAIGRGAVRVAERPVSKARQAEIDHRNAALREGVSEWYDSLAPTDETYKLLGVMVRLDEGNDAPMTKSRALALLNRASAIRDKQRKHEEIELEQRREVMACTTQSWDADAPTRSVEAEIVTPIAPLDALCWCHHPRSHHVAGSMECVSCARTTPPCPLFADAIETQAARDEAKKPLG